MRAAASGASAESALVCTPINTDSLETKFSPDGSFFDGLINELQAQPNLNYIEYKCLLTVPEKSNDSSFNYLGRDFVYKNGEIKNEMSNLSEFLKVLINSDNFFRNDRFRIEEKLPTIIGKTFKVNDNSWSCNLIPQGLRPEILNLTDREINQNYSNFNFGIEVAIEEYEKGKKTGSIPFNLFCEQQNR